MLVRIGVYSYEGLHRVQNRVQHVHCGQYTYCAQYVTGTQHMHCAQYTNRDQFMCPGLWEGYAGGVMVMQTVNSSCAPCYGRVMQEGSWPCKP